ncbi:M23 family metallopeptidase [Saccharothrix longispora]|uniref:Murein DD-endopeptidase MepM/ murein hydrolase activator NlpD n=1 Tax=Saccharothrix longispora TaxID=33920 RepID=A0ABU1Q166_9PSEU|nr:M23 family metallopeptidase [Saccharothrix longispora]MDR6596109.1 murein DD-endopeptidase MepM/ murein hydrolase activator NlpD [Saccharothrix longispora]
MTPTMRTPLVLALTALLALSPPLPPLPAPPPWPSSWAASWAPLWAPLWGASVAGASRAPRFAWPLAPPHEVVRRFERPPGPYAAGHRGVDLSAPPGAAVLAAADGVVLHSGPVADRTLVSLLHAGGLRTTYEPVIPSVRTGQDVRRGDPIGTLRPGHEGCPTPACLHWGALRTTPPRTREYLDPLRLVLTGRVRLLPRAAPTAAAAAR